MSDSRAKELISRGDTLFNKRLPILSLWQAITEQFYPEHADYTYVRSMGMEFASHLMTGVPAMASRDLANAIGAMLRPPGQVWFHPRTESEVINRDIDALRWLDWAGERMRLMMYDPNGGLVRALKEGDRDFASIGNVCVSLRPNENMNGLLFKSHHMRDVAWAENMAGKVNEIHCKRKVAARDLVKLFPKTVHQSVKKAFEGSDPHMEVMCRHTVIPMADYEASPNSDKTARRKAMPFMSIWLDVDNSVVLEETPQWQFGYVTPRWDTVSGFGYGYSPPSTINIADARMLQQITLTLLEAGQKAVDPPYKGVAEVIQGGVNFFAGGVTWVDADYDERTGKAIEPLLGTNPNLGWGVDREKRIQEIIAQGHFLNQIRLPDTTHARTAFEVEKLWQEFIRNTTPLFEPIQVEYNSPLCADVLEMMMRFNALGNPMQTMPPVLRGQKIKFTFDSPLTLAASRANAQAFTQVLQLTQGAVQLDPTLVHDLDADTAYRDALYGSGAPSSWIVPKKVADLLKARDRQQAAQQQQQATAATQAGTAADIGQKVGDAAQSLSAGGINPQKLAMAASQLQQGGTQQPLQPQTGGLQ